MRCPSCGEEVKKKWRYCPRCGESVKRVSFRDAFRSIEEEMEEFMKGFEPFSRSFEAFDLKPSFRKPTRRGFSVRIRRRGKEKPKIDIQTFGDVDRKRIEDEVYKRIGKKPKIEEKVEEKPEKVVELPEVTEEPKTKAKRVDEQLQVEMELPGVKSLDQIEIRKLPESIEVRARAKDKGYFKILKVPKGLELLDKKFSDEKLQIVLT